MDYRIESNGTVVVFLSERATHRASGPNPKIGARLAVKTKFENLTVRARWRRRRFRV